MTEIHEPGNRLSFRFPLDTTVTTNTPVLATPLNSSNSPSHAAGLPRPLAPRTNHSAAPTCRSRLADDQRRIIMMSQFMPVSKRNLEYSEMDD